MSTQKRLEAERSTVEATDSDTDRRPTPRTEPGDRPATTTARAETHTAHETRANSRITAPMTVVHRGGPGRGAFESRLGRRVGSSVVTAHTLTAHVKRQYYVVYVRCSEDRVTLREPCSTACPSVRSPESAPGLRGGASQGSPARHRSPATLFRIRYVDYTIHPCGGTAAHSHSTVSQ